MGMRGNTAMAWGGAPQTAPCYKAVASVHLCPGPSRSSLTPAREDLCKPTDLRAGWRELSPPAAHTASLCAYPQGTGFGVISSYTLYQRSGSPGKKVTFPEEAKTHLNSETNNEIKLKKKKTHLN